MNAIPTTYKGIKFRSRLEATWAAFFDELGYQWEYEPVDANGYIPDFLIRIGSEDQWIGYPSMCFVEVKPAVSVDDLWEWREKYRDKAPEQELLFVGVGPFQGPLFEPSQPQWGHTLILGVFRPAVGGTIDAAWTGSGKSLTTTCHTVSGGGMWTALPNSIERAWALAKNATQWRPSR